MRMRVSGHLIRVRVMSIWIVECSKVKGGWADGKPDFFFPFLSLCIIILRTYGRGRSDEIETPTVVSIKTAIKKCMSPTKKEKGRKRN